jgi:alpha-L-rhamnosidase
MVPKQQPHTLFHPRRVLSLCAGIGCVFLATQSLSMAEAGAPAAPSGLLLERLSTPLGIENATPAMSWILNHPDPNQHQTAYQVQVATRAVKLVDGNPDVWDSGPIASAESSNARYAGPPLDPNAVYCWRVRIWDRHGAASPYSAPQMFVTAIRDEWRATPIWTGIGDHASRFAFLRHEFEIPAKEMEQAILHVSAVSGEPASQYVYRLYLNGKFVGCGPERGFNNTVRYNTYEVSDFLETGGRNAVAALNYTTLEQKFILQLDVRYTDGTSQVIVSDRSWKALPGDDVYVDGGNAGHSSYYVVPREFINATKYPFGWKRGGYDDAHWSPAVETDPIHNLRPSTQENEQQHLVDPVRVIERAPGHYFVDFGRSLIGGFRLRDVVGRAGQPVEIRLGQELVAPQTVRHAKRTGNRYQEVWTLTDGPQTLTHWGYRSYRYAEIIGAPTGLDATHFQAAVLRQPFDPGESHFESSDFVLNDLWDMLKHGIQATSLDVYVDSHSRERRNYEGDAYINQLSQYALQRQYAFPRYSVEYLHYRPTWPTEYKPLSILMAWNDYLYTGNADSLKEHYAVLQTKTLENFINPDFLVEKAENAGSPWGRDLVDWPPALRDDYVFSRFNTVVNAFNCRAVELLGRIADVLGKEEDAAHYHQLANRLRDAINDHFYDPDRGAFRDGKEIDHHALHASIIPVALQIARDDFLDPTSEHIFSRGMQCNLYGAQFLLESLYVAGRGDLALKRMNAIEGNSWGHMMYRLGATIATEAWDPSLKANMAFSHGGWGSPPVNNIARGLFGIQPLEPAFNRFQIKPQPGSLAWAQYKQPSIKGPIRVQFIQTTETFEMTVTVPVNTRAEVYLPRMGKEDAQVVVNGKPREGRIDGDFVLIRDVASGTHTFMRSLVGTH